LLGEDSQMTLLHDLLHYNTNSLLYFQIYQTFIDPHRSFKCGYGLGSDMINPKRTRHPIKNSPKIIVEKRLPV